MSKDSCPTECIMVIVRDKVAALIRLLDELVQDVLVRFYVFERFGFGIYETVGVAHGLDEIVYVDITPDLFDDDLRQMNGHWGCHTRYALQEW